MSWKIVALVLLVGISIFMMGCAKTNEDEHPVSRAFVEQLIQKNIPLGTSKSTVSAFLDQHGIENSGHIPHASNDTLYAIFRNAEGSTTTFKKSIQVIFQFSNDKLIAYSITEKLTGP